MKMRSMIIRVSKAKPVTTMARILILEDERAINDLIALNLNMVGHTPVQAFTGKEALALAAHESFDLLLLDVMLPDTDGFSVYEKLKGTPAIFLTALSETADKVKGFEREAWDVSFMGESRTVDVHIQRIRKKLNLGEHIATIYRYGYRFEEHP